MNFFFGKNPFTFLLVFYYFFIFLKFLYTCWDCCSQGQTYVLMIWSGRPRSNSIICVESNQALTHAPHVNDWSPRVLQKNSQNTLGVRTSQNVSGQINISEGLAFTCFPSGQKNGRECTRKYLQIEKFHPHL